MGHQNILSATKRFPFNTFSVDLVDFSCILNISVKWDIFNKKQESLLHVKTHVQYVWFKFFVQTA